MSFQTEFDSSILDSSLSDISSPDSSHDDDNDDNDDDHDVYLPRRIDPLAFDFTQGDDPLFYEKRDHPLGQGLIL